jgi:hypothetical protein
MNIERFGLALVIGFVVLLSCVASLFRHASGPTPTAVATLARAGMR